MALAPSLGQLVESWARLYSDTKVVSAGVVFVHLGGVVLGGGFAIAADRLAVAIASTPEDSSHQLSEIHAVHRPVLLGLGLTFLSGLLMFAANFDVYLTRPLYWIKMGVVLVLVGNGALLVATEHRLRHGSLPPSIGWPRLRRFARASAFLWFATLFLGAALLAV